jgi:hypothetical protein
MISRPSRASAEGPRFENPARSPDPVPKDRTGHVTSWYDTFTFFEAPGASESAGALEVSRALP